MKKLTTILLLCFFVTTNCSSQEKDKGYIGISFGAAIPTGTFAIVNPFDRYDTGGSNYAAKTGLMFDISSAYKFSKHWGICATLRMQVNPGSGTSNDYQDVESTDWKITTFAGGVYGSFASANGKISLELRAMPGYLSAKSPEVIITTSNMQWRKLESATDNSIALLTGVGLKYNASKRICFLFNIDNLFAGPKFDVKITESSGQNIEYTTEEVSILTLNISAGVGFRL